MTLDNQKIKGLFSRVYKNQMKETDAVDIKEYAKRVFGDGSLNPDPSLLHQFNNLVVQQADEVAKPMVADLLSLLATTKTASRDQVVKYEIPQKSKARVRWSANGSGVDLVRVEGKKFEVAVPKTFSTGFYYEPFGMVTEPEENFRKLVDDLANAKVRLYLEQIRKLTDAAVSSGDVPTPNQLIGDNLTLANYNKLGSVIARYGGRPVFVGDSILIDHFAMQQATDTTYSKLLSDRLKEELATELNPTRIARTDAVNLVNPFIDDENSKVELPVNEGYMFAGSATQKPFIVTEFGGMRQLTEQDIEDERVKLKISQDADIQLIFGQSIGVVRDNSLSL